MAKGEADEGLRGGSTGLERYSGILDDVACSLIAFLTYSDWISIMVLEMHEGLDNSRIRVTLECLMEWEYWGPRAAEINSCTPMRPEDPLSWVARPVFHLKSPLPFHPMPTTISAPPLWASNRRNANSQVRALLSH